MLYVLRYTQHYIIDKNRTNDNVGTDVLKLHIVK